MTKNKIRNPLLLLLAAFIWGCAFVAQTSGGDVIGAYSFNCIRSLIGALVLVPVFLLMDKAGWSSHKPETKEDRKLLWTAGILCGIALCIASNLQQVAMYVGASTGEAGFLTACYSVFIPIFSIFLGKKCQWNIWVGVLLTIIGLFLLCITGKFTLTTPDILLLLCAVFFSVQIMLVDHFSPLLNGVRLSCIQFLVSGSLSFIPMVLVDMKHSVSGFMAWLPTLQSGMVWVAILYAGVCSCGIAYTLQIVGQNGTNPTVAALIMSLESVFSALAGWVLLNQKLSGRQILGCTLIFIAITISQLPEDLFTKSSPKENT